jgi:hypothetical protein
VATATILNTSLTVAGRLGILLPHVVCARGALTSGGGRCACVAMVGRAMKSGIEEKLVSFADSELLGFGI